MDRMERAGLKATVIIRYDRCPQLIGPRGLQKTELQGEDQHCKWYCDCNGTSEVWGLVYKHRSNARRRREECDVREVLRSPHYRFPRYSSQKEGWPKPRDMLRALRRFYRDLRQALSGPFEVVEYFRTEQGAQWARVLYNGNSFIVFDGLEVHWCTHRLGWAIPLNDATGVVYTRCQDDTPRLPGLTVVGRGVLVKMSERLSSSSPIDQEI